MNEAEPVLHTQVGVSKRAELFGIDLRTLAFTRIALAVLLLYDLAMRYRDLPTMYSDEGLFPIADVLTYYGQGSWRWSMHLWSGAPAYQNTLFALAAVFGVMLLFGLLTRLATIASWVFLLSIHMRAPVLVTGGDVLLCMMLFWGMFLPWGRRASVDAWRRGVPTGNGPVISIASAAIMLQIAFMYLFTGCSKCNELWFSGRALEAVFSNELFVRPMGIWLLQFSSLLKILTYGALVLELAGPLLLFCPWKTRVVRPLTVLCFVGLHLGIELTMTVVIFSFASLSALTVFTPGWVWDMLGWGNLRQSDTATTAAAGRGGWQWLAARAIDAVLVCAMIAIVVINPLVQLFGPRVLDTIPRPIVGMFNAAGLGQRWDMFSHPNTTDHRYIAIANLCDGSKVDLLRDQPCTGEELPADLTGNQPSQRWVQVMVDLQRAQSSYFRKPLARYLAKKWNAEHADTRRAEHVQLALIFAREPSESDPRPIERLVLAQIDPLADGDYKDGKREGHWVHHFPNGNKESEGSYRQGNEEGKWTYWNEEGVKEGEGSYVAGQLHGKWVFHMEDGQVREAFFHHGRIIPPPLDTAAQDTPHSTP